MRQRMMRRGAALVAGLACLYLQNACSALKTAKQPDARPANAALRSVPSGYPVPVGKRFRDRTDGPELVVIPAGSFIMGASEAETTREGRRAETAAYERPQHVVSLGTPLAVGRLLVTRKEYGAFVAATQRPAPPGCNVLDGKWQNETQRSYADPGFPQTDLHPALCVGVVDAEDYVAWLSTQTGHRYRLLHEAEWEYAARAGSSGARWWADDRSGLCRHANGADLSYDRAHPGDDKVNRSCDDGFAHSNPGDAFAPNAFGLHDMLGNVWEWTADCFVSSYAGATANASDDITTGDCTRRAIRGASWHNYPDALRSAARFWLPPDMRSSSLGFRVARLADASTHP